MHPGGLTLAHNNKTACCVSQTLTLPERTIQTVSRPFDAPWSWPGPVWCWSRFIEFPLASSSLLSASCKNLPDSLSPYSITTFFFFFFSKIGSCFFQLRPRAETLKECGRSLAVSRSVLSLLLLCYCVKTHLLRKHHSSSPENHIFPALQWQGLRWLWRGSSLFLLFKQLHSTKTTSPNCLFQSLEQCLNYPWWSLPSCLMIK